MKFNDPLHHQKFKRGEQLSQSKLDENKVREARALHEEYLQTVRDLQDTFSIKALANRYGVHERTMEKALAGITWSHVV